MGKRSLYLLLLLSRVLAVPAQLPAATPLPIAAKPALPTDQWKGFERIYLTIAGHPAWYVRPIHPLPGNPWIWRASFPDWHTDMDSLLLIKGCYVAYISIDDQFGSPYAMQVWDLADRYTRLGGPITIYPVTTGPQELHGHHFPIEHPGKWADWVLDNSYPVRKRLPYGPYLTMRQGLSHSFARFAGSTAPSPASTRPTATVAFFGGSITYNPGWRNKTVAWLQERFPETDFHFISAGIPSLGSPAHVFRLQQDVLDSGKIDLLFVEAAVNDRGNGTDSLTQIRSLEGIVRHARRSNPSMDIILMSFADPLKTADYDQGRSPVEIQNQETVAERYRLPSINLAKEIRDKIENQEFSWEYDFKNLHPSPFGQELYFATIKKLLETAYPNEPSPPAQPSLPAQPSPPAHPQPFPAPLDAKSFGNGRYYAPDVARTGDGWVRDNNWHPDDGLPIQKGFVHVPVLQATKPGATLSFAFTGTAVGIAVDAGPDAGTIAWSVDGSPEQSLDLFTPWSAGRHLPWYLVLGQGLNNQHHTLKLRIEDNKNKDSKGTACRIIHFLVNQ